MNNETKSQTTSDRGTPHSGGSSRRRPVGASPRAVVMLAGVTFALGIGVGGLGVHFAQESHRPQTTTWKTDQVDQWSKTLGLDARQRQQLDETFDDVWSQYRTLFAKWAPKKQEIDIELRAKVKSFLDAKQAQRYEQAIAEADVKRRAYFGPLDVSGPEQPIVPTGGHQGQ